MTRDLIDRADALAAIALGDTVSQLQAKILAIPAAALPARGVGVTWHPFDTAPRDGSRFLAQGGGLDAIDICSYNARVGCWDCGAVTLDDTDHEPEGYNRPAQWVPLAALAPTDAAQAREAAARLLLDMLYMRNGAHEGVSKEDAQAMWDAASTREGYAAVDAFLRSIIGEART